MGVVTVFVTILVETLSCGGSRARTYSMTGDEYGSDPFEAHAGELIWVQNWFEELKAKAGN